MIGFIHGTVKECLADRMILFTSGIGYEVFLSKPSLEQCAKIGADIELYIHTHVTEDDIRLYGFLSSAEKNFFRKLTSVSGIGAKSAMQVLSFASIPEITRAIRAKDIAFLQTCPGIGKKTAERIALELHDKLETLGKDEKARPQASTSPRDEVVSALLNLGYKRNESEDTVSGIDLSTFPTFDTILKESLKRLGR